MHAAIIALQHDDEDLTQRLERLDARLDDLEDGMADTAQVVDEFRDGFERHARCRCAVLYPALESHCSARGAAREGAEELALAHDVVARLEAGPSDVETVVARGRVLIELIERHLEKEEENLLLRVRRLSPGELDQLEHALAMTAGDHGDAVGGAAGGR